MLKTTRSFEQLAPKTFRIGNNEVVGDGNGRADKTVVNLSKNKNSKKSTHMPNVVAMREPNFLTSNAKKAFNHLRLAFIKTLILPYFDLENYIQIETNASDYTISKVLSQLNLNSNIVLNNSNLDKFDFS